MLDLNNSIINVGDNVSFTLYGDWVPGTVSSFGKSKIDIGVTVANIVYNGLTYVRRSIHIQKIFEKKSVQVEIQEKPCKTCSRKNFTNCNKCWWCDCSNPTALGKIK